MINHPNRSKRARAGHKADVILTPGGTRLETEVSFEGDTIILTIIPHNANEEIRCIVLGAWEAEHLMGVLAAKIPVIRKAVS